MVQARLRRWDRAPLDPHATDSRRPWHNMGDDDRLFHKARVVGLVGNDSLRHSRVVIPAVRNDAQPDPDRTVDAAGDPQASMSRRDRSSKPCLDAHG